VASIAADAGKRGPSRAWYLVSLAIVIVTIAVFAYFLISRLNTLTGNLMQLVVPGQIDLHLAQTGTYSIFHERQSVVDGQLLHSNDIAGLRVSLRSTNGTDVRLAPTGASTTYSNGGRAGVAIYEFEIREPGTYRLTAEYDGGRALPRAVLAVGLDFVGERVAAILGAIAIFFTGLISAVVLVVVVFVKRRKAPRASAATAELDLP
jgi:hypothetical protein